MTILHVRSVPDNLYRQLQQLADARKRSLSAQVITMLATAVEEEERRAMQAKTLASIQGRRFKAPKDAPTTLDLLHEDRSR
jgi:plasmid stability protein